MTIMQRHSVEEHASALGSYLPTGRLFESAFINGSNFRQVLTGFAGEFRTAELSLKDFADFFIADDANMLISDWERALAIPDGCFDGTGTIAERQRDILAKLNALGAQTLGDFETLGDIFNLSIVIYPGRDVYDNPLLAPNITFQNIKQARFTLVIVYTAAATSILPLTLPFTIGTALIPLLTCLYQTIQQANCTVLFDVVIP